MKLRRGPFASRAGRYASLAPIRRFPGRNTADTTSSAAGCSRAPSAIRASWSATSSEAPPAVPRLRREASHEGVPEG